MFSYVGTFTTAERRGHGGGISVYRVDPSSDAWTHEQLIQIANPSFRPLDRKQRFCIQYMLTSTRSVPMRPRSKWAHHGAQ